MFEPSARTKAVIDWLELEVITLSATQGAHIRAKFPDLKIHATACDPDTRQPYPKGLENSTSTVFRIRLQNPTTFKQLSRLGELGLQCEPRPAAIEVAFDVYAADACVDQLAEIAFDLYRFTTVKPGGDWYFYRAKGEGRQYVNTLDDRTHAVQLLSAGWQLTDTNDKSASIRYHIYSKVTDGGGLPLTKKDKPRARFEVTLQGEALPFGTMADLESFQFTRFADHFKFRMLAPDLHPFARYAIARSYVKQIGKRGTYPRPHRTISGVYSASDRPTSFRRSTVSNDALSRLHALKQLRNLTLRWQR